MNARTLLFLLLTAALCASVACDKGDDAKVVTPSTDAAVADKAVDGAAGTPAADKAADGAPAADKAADGAPAADKAADPAAVAAEGGAVADPAAAQGGAPAADGGTPVDPAAAQGGAPAADQGGAPADPAAAQDGAAPVGELPLGQNDAAFLEGIAGDGPLYTTIVTSMGNLNCELYEKQAPNAVMNFVGLARGLKPFRDATGAVAKKPFYEGVTFHRVIPNFMIQVGDPTGTGAYNPGYGFGNEIDPGLKHDRGGLLSMANTGRPNSNGSQFFVTEVATPWLDGKHPIFGACDDASVELIKKIARVPTGPGDKPLEPITITSVSFRRGK